MRIACLLSGEMRDYLKCYKNLFDFIGNHTIDFFIVTWDKLGGRIYENNANFNNNNIDEENIKNLYKPKILKVLKKR